MKLIADISNGILTINDTKFNISNRVRTLRDGTRASHEVVCSLPDDMPYDPQQFPKGVWNITGIEWQREKGFDYNTYGPVKIRTDAWQWVNVWTLDDDKDYHKKTDRLVKDYGYLLHYSKSSTTYGCIRIGTPDEAVILGRLLEAALINKEPITLEVI
jgi:hypothetical protein